MMKNKLLLPLLFLCLLGFQKSFAQLEFGVLAGANYSGGYYSPDTYFNNIGFIPGFHIHAFIQKPFNNWLSVRTELGFSRRGIHFNKALKDAKYNLDFITLPVLAEFKIKKIQLGVGPELSMLIAQNPEPIFDFFSKNEVKVNLTGDVTYLISDHFEAGFRYTHGLSPQSSIEYTDVEGNEIGKSYLYLQSLQLSGAYKF